MPPRSKLTPKKKRRKRARVSDGVEERSPEEMVVDREESEQRQESERGGEGGRQRDDDSGRVEEEEGENVEGCEPEESEDAEFAGARTGQSGAPPFSDEDEMEMVQFVQAHGVLFSKEHVHYFDKNKKDRLWEEIGRCVGRSGQDVKRWFESQRTRYGKLTRDQAKLGSGRKFQMTE